MRTTSILIIAGVLAGLGCEGRIATQDVPPDLENLRTTDATFTPGTAGEAVPSWVRELRVKLDLISDEGLAIGMADDPPADRIAWLVHDPELSPPNWIVSGAGDLPADRDALRAHIAYLRVRVADQFVVGFTGEGTLVDEATGSPISRPIAVTKDGPNIPVRLNLAGTDGLEQAQLP